MYTPYLLTLLISSASSLLLPTVHNQTTPLLNPTVYCNPRGLHVPRYQDCLGAIEQFPYFGYDEYDYFHTGSPNDPYQLPKAWSFGTCRVEVDMHSIGTETYNWARLYITAWEVSYWCLKKPRLPLYGGGWVLGGPRGKILVEAGYHSG